LEFPSSLLEGVYWRSGHSSACFDGCGLTLLVEVGRSEVGPKWSEVDSLT